MKKDIIAPAYSPNQPDRLSTLSLSLPTTRIAAAEVAAVGARRPACGCDTRARGWARRRLSGRGARARRRRRRRLRAGWAQATVPARRLGGRRGGCVRGVRRRYWPRIGHAVGARCHWQLADCPAGYNKIIVKVDAKISKFS